MLFEEISGAFNGKFPSAKQVVNKEKVFDIYGAEMPVALFIFSWLQNVKFRFPETQKGVIYLKHRSHFPHTVILLAEEDLIGRNIGLVNH